MMLYAPQSNHDQERINQFRKELGLHPFGLTIDYKSNRPRANKKNEILASIEIALERRRRLTNNPRIQPTKAT
jgi:hypothetical protein